MNVKNLIKKIDASKALSIFVVGLGVAGSLLSTKVDANNRKEMKNELKDELLKELSEKN